MNKFSVSRTQSRLVLEQLEQRLTPASSVFEDQVTNIFRFGLNRNPEAEGLQAFVSSLEAGNSLKQVANAIFQSEEHQRSVITSYYRAFLNREPDSAGLDAFLGVVKEGASSEEVLAGFLSSAEYTGSETSDEAYVELLYQRILGRKGDEQGTEAHLKALQSGGSRFGVALTFLTSRENDATEVQNLYQKILGRDPSEEEVAGWVGQLARPDTDQEGVMVGFLSSSEGEKRLGADVVFGTLLGSEGWWLRNLGMDSLPGASMDEESGQARIQDFVDRFRAVETFSNPLNPGQVVAQLREGKFPDPDAKNKLPDRPLSGTNGASAYPDDFRNTPGALQDDLANMGIETKPQYTKLFGRWAGKPETLKASDPLNVEFAFSKYTLSHFFGIEVDANGLITSIGAVSASVLLGNESVARTPGFDPLKNPLIGQNIETLKHEQLGLYLAGRVYNDTTKGLYDQPRIAHFGVLANSLELQYQAAKNYLYGLLNNYANNPSYKETFAKAKTLFGSTLEITASTAAFGIQAGQMFKSKFNAGFISGGGYVRGEQNMFGLISALVQANESPGVTVIWKAPVGPDFTYVGIKRVDSGNPVEKVFTMDKTPTNYTDGYPSMVHYGAVMSATPIDDLINDPKAWGVTDQTGIMGYERHDETHLQKGEGTLPTGEPAYSYTYEGLGNDQTLKMNGSSSYRIAPPTPNASVDPIKVTNEGYTAPGDGNNDQSVIADQKIDMSAFEKAPTNINDFKQAYDNMFYVDTRKAPFKIAHVSDKSFVPPTPAEGGLYMYYVNGAGGTVAGANKIINSDSGLYGPPGKYSYRVNVANLDILGQSADPKVFGEHFIMTPLPPPAQGSGIIDAGGLTGSLSLETNTSLTKVLLGKGTNQIDAGSVGTGILYVMNSGMAAGVSSTVFSGLRLGIDKVDLTKFGAVKNLTLNVIAAFNNKVGNSSTKDLYPQYTNTVEVSFIAGGKAYKFLVLDAGQTPTEDSALVAAVRSSIQA